jgi:hypothetical protein
MLGCLLLAVEEHHKRQPPNDRNCDDWGATVIVLWLPAGFVVPEAVCSALFAVLCLQCSVRSQCFETALAVIAWRGAIA